MGKLGGSERPDQGPLPPEPEHLQQVLLPPQVVSVSLPIRLERCFTVYDKVDVVEEEDSAE